MSLCNVNGIASKFILVDETEEGVLKNIAFENDENFNFAYDIVDRLAETQPDKLAMLHISKDGRETRFTFADMKKYSSKVANYVKNFPVEWLLPEYKGITEEGFKYLKPLISGNPVILMQDGDGLPEYVQRKGIWLVKKFLNPVPDFFL